jgi:hypothetical protein
MDCGPAWSWETIKALVAYWPHCSAIELDGIALLHKDIQ